jgi:hypothetical protein
MSGAHDVPAISPEHAGRAEEPFWHQVVRYSGDGLGASKSAWECRWARLAGAVGDDNKVMATTMPACADGRQRVGRQLEQYCGRNAQGKF